MAARLLRLAPSFWTPASAARAGSPEAASSAVLFEFEGDFGVDPVFDDLVVGDLRFEVLDIYRANIAQGLARLLNGGTSGGFPAGFGLRKNLNDFQHDHISGHRIVAAHILGQADRNELMWGKREAGEWGPPLWAGTGALARR